MFTIDHTHQINPYPTGEALISHGQVGLSGIFSIVSRDERNKLKSIVFIGNHSTIDLYSQCKGVSSCAIEEIRAMEYQDP